MKWTKYVQNIFCHRGKNLFLCGQNFNQYGIIFCHAEMNECNIDEFFG
jgi:hypothetical protein